MNVEIRDERFRAVVGDDVEIEEVGSGFDFIEGPIWNHVEQHLVFSDIPGNIMRRWRPDGSVETWRQPSNMANGNAYDPAGRVVTCEHATSRITRTEADGSITVLASRYGGKELNSPNDIVVKRDGSIYFTDPSFGRMEYYGRPREQQLTFQGVYRLEPDSGALTLLVLDFDQPNGLCFSLDQSQLFVNDTMSGHVQRNQIAALKGDMEREKAEIGLFITLEPPTAPMRSEAAAAGFYEPSHFLDHRFPRVQILTIEELLSGAQAQYPRFAPDATFRRAPRRQRQQREQKRMI